MLRFDPQRPVASSLAGPDSDAASRAAGSVASAVATGPASTTVVAGCRPAPHVVVLGEGGTGKGTLTAALARADGFTVFDTGRALRALPTDTPAGAHLQAELRAGRMAPTALVMDLLLDAIASPPPGSTGWLLDGIPRRREQGDAALALVRAGKLRIDGVLVLRARPEILEARLVGRRVCRDCGAAYHLEFIPPPASGRCACGGALIQRGEDAPEAHEARGIRTALFVGETIPTISLLEEAGIPVRIVDANGTPEETLAAARIALQSLLAGPACAPAPQPPRRRAPSTR